MAQSWKYAFALGLVGTALTVGCVVKEGDDDAVGGESGEGGTGGSTGGSGGSGGKATGGSAGKATGGSAGKATGGSSGTGTGGTTGGSSGDAGMSGSDTGGTGGTTAGTGGTGGSNIVAMCEDEELEGSTPYPTCEASGSTDTCGTCIEMNCCEESKACYATEPYDACGWGGPSEDEFDGLYSGAGEIGCYLTCMAEYVADNDGICDDAGIDACNAMCTSDCGGIPTTSMNALLTCVNTSCSQDCFESDAETCGD